MSLSSASLVSLPPVLVLLIWMYGWRVGELGPRKYLDTDVCEGPVYLVHGTEDETVPYRSSLLLEELADNISLLTIKEGSHNNLNTFKEYHVWLEEILN